MADQMNRKETAEWLDRAAARAEFIDRDPATRKQCWFLAGLMEQAGWNLDDIGCGITNTSAVLTKKKASGWIDTLLNEKKAA